MRGSIGCSMTIAKPCAACSRRLKARYRRLQVVFDGSLELPVRWPDGVESVRQEGRVVSILASNNVDAIVGQVLSLAGASVESFPVTLKEIFLENVRNN